MNGASLGGHKCDCAADAFGLVRQTLQNCTSGSEASERPGGDWMITLWSVNALDKMV